MKYQLVKQMLDTASRFVGVNNRVGKLIKNYAKLCEANHLSSHFSTHLKPIVVTEDALKKISYQIRHQVYCEELNFEPIKADKLEVDEYDEYSLPCMIQHGSSGTFAGTVRLVCPQKDSETLPIIKYCLDGITDETLNPLRFPINEICEISRLAVPKQFRRRQTDNFKGSATGAIDISNYSKEDLRYFPLIAVGLYFAAAAAALEQGKIKHAYVMMEPRLARSLRFIGIKFKQIGPVVDYHGDRAPYYCDRQILEDGLPTGFKKMLEDIRLSISRQI
jgi:N-acyl amino acid synthase of PEP-CTERM/exosortase system